MSYNSIRKYSYPKKCGAKVRIIIHISEVFPAYLLFNAIITYFGGWRQRKIEMKNEEKEMESRGRWKWKAEGDRNEKTRM